MARRRLSRHQKKRIDDAQQALTSSSDQKLQGLVISHHGGKVVVEMTNGLSAECAVKSNLGAIVCGDHVIYEKSTANEYRILAVRPRNNLLQRVDGFGQIKSVAANITQLFICLAVKPEPNLFLLDQYLLVAEQQNIEAIIVLNKIDLLEDCEDAFGLIGIYTKLGYRIVRISAKFGEGMKELQALFDHNASVLSGVSGVGKSSITAAILPDIPIKIAEISEANEEGRHTTRTSRLYHLANGGELIDTPGVRGFKPQFDPDQPIANGFREIAEYAHQCKFANCKHVNEPKCAVIEATKTGDINPQRYEHYLHMLQN